MLKNIFITDEDASISLSEVMILMKAEGKDMGKATRRDVHSCLLELNEGLEFKQLPGHTPRSPRVKYLGLREIRASDLKQKTNKLIAVSTAFEMANIKTIMRHAKAVQVGDPDVKSILVGFDEDFKTSFGLLQPSDVGSYAMLLAMKTVLIELPEVTSCFKTGGCAALANAGTIIVTQADMAGNVVHDQYLDKEWKTAPGFPSSQLIQASHSAAATKELQVSRSPMITGPKMASHPTERPYELEASGFLTACQRQGILRAGCDIGIASVVTDTFREPAYSTKSPVACMENLCHFWKIYFQSY